jgi:hypothetical protein
VDKLTTGAPADVAVPVRLTVCGLLLELSMTVKVPVSVPLAVGAKVTLIIHVEPAATPFPQLSVSAKSPLVEMPVICKGAVPLLERATVCGALTVPTLWLPKFRLVGESDAAGSRETFATKASP